MPAKPYNSFQELTADLVIKKESSCYSTGINAELGAKNSKTLISQYCPLGFSVE